MTYQATYNKQARQWDVTDAAGNIVAMCGGGKRGEETAKRKAVNLSHTDWMIETTKAILRCEEDGPLVSATRDIRRYQG